MFVNDHFCAGRQTLRSTYASALQLTVASHYKHGQGASRVVALPFLAAEYIIAEKIGLVKSQVPEAAQAMPLFSTKTGSIPCKVR